MSYTRYAIYYLPPPGALAAFGARWLGWDAECGVPIGQPAVEGIADITAAPRKYGFHGTLKPPFRLAGTRTAEELSEAVAHLARGMAAAQCDGLALTRLGGFLALTPLGDASGIARIAATCVRDLDGFRARADEVELARRRKAGLSARQAALLQRWGYPYVLEEFRFHMTLTGKLPGSRTDTVARAIGSQLPALPQPFVLDAVALAGERADGKFELIQRYVLTG